MGDRLTDEDAEYIFHRHLPDAAEVAEIRWRQRHQHVYTLAEEGPSQKLAALERERSGVAVCCGLPVAPDLTHQDIAILQKGGLLGKPVRPHYVRQPPPPPWLLALPWLPGAGLAAVGVFLLRRRWITKRLSAHAARLASFKQQAEALDAKRRAASALPPRPPRPRRDSPPRRDRPADRLQ